MLRTLVSTPLTTIGVAPLVLSGICFAVNCTLTLLLIKDRSLILATPWKQVVRLITAQWRLVFGPGLLVGPLAYLGLLGLIGGIFVTLTNLFAPFFSLRGPGESRRLLVPSFGFDTRSDGVLDAQP